MTSPEPLIEPPRVARLSPGAWRFVALMVGIYSVSRINLGIQYSIVPKKSLA